MKQVAKTRTVTIRNPHAINETFNALWRSLKRSLTKAQLKLLDDPNNTDVPMSADWPMSEATLDRIVTTLEARCIPISTTTIEYVVVINYPFAYRITPGGKSMEEWARINEEKP